MRKTSFARLPRSARARRRAARAPACLPRPDKQLQTNLAPDAPARQPSGAHARSREACTPEHSTHGISLSSSQLAAGLQTALQGLLLPSGLQAKLLRYATAALADALAGPAAPPSLRLRLRRGLLAAARLAYAARRVVQTYALAESLMHTGGVPPALATEAELANALCTLLLLPFSVCTASSPPSKQPPSPPPLFRAVAATSALAADGLDLAAAAEGLAAQQQQPGELAAAAGKVVDLVLGSLSLADGSREAGQQLLEAGAEAAKIVRPCLWAAARERRQQDGASCRNGDGNGDEDEGGGGDGAKR